MNNTHNINFSRSLNRRSVSGGNDLGFLLFYFHVFAAWMHGVQING